MPLYFINICNIILFQLEQSIHDQSLQFNDELMETGDSYVRSVVIEVNLVAWKHLVIVRN